MKHQHNCHCGFEKHLAKFKKGRKLGVFGIAFLGLHILWHVAECLVLPAIFVAFSHGHSQEDALANESYQSISVREAENLINFLPWRGAQPNASTATTYLYLPKPPDTIRESFG